MVAAEEVEPLVRLSTPPLQKTISENEVVRGRSPALPEPLRGVLKNSGMLPPVVPPFKSPRHSSPRKTKKLHRSKTVENSDLNGHEQVRNCNGIVMLRNQLA